MAAPILSDYDSFKDLSVTVGQTRNLANQGITISWSGAKTTSPGEYATQYLQVMQCWGDPTAGPSPETCEWGAPNSTVASLMGVNAARRDVVKGDDPAEDQQLATDPDLKLEPPIENPNLKAYRIPFRSVNGVLSKETNDLNKVFDSSTTNEISAARTASDGTGTVSFETQTSLEAPQLGCGASSLRCWLVIVPRGDLNLDGTANSTISSGRIFGSPLSASAWNNRIQVPLDFQNVSQNCPIGNAEERLVGADSSAAAVTSWQPALCKTGTTYGFSLIGDDEGRRQIVSTSKDAARLALVSNALDDTDRGTATIAYAPVAQSAIVVAFTIDYDLYPGSPASAKNGQQVQDLTLSPRLVAKLLTQTYRTDVPGGGAPGSVVASNPKSLLDDQEFLALNPSFVGFQSDVLPAGMVVELGSSDANAEVWAWLRADPLARAFLAGQPDENGVRINPAYVSLNLATDSTVDSFPKADLTIVKGSTDPAEPGYGTLDLRPYANDSLDSAYHAFKADAGAKTSWDPFKQPPAYSANGSQPTGVRFTLALTDAASAARYGLPVAKIVNGAGQAIAPTPTSIATGISAFTASTDDATVSEFDGTARTAGAYPLPTLTYAAVNVCASSKSDIKGYSKFIKYAATSGQVSGDAPGQLPRGYVPLDAAQVKQATTTSSGLSAAYSKCAPTSTPKPTSSATATPPLTTTIPPVTTPPVTTDTSTSTATSVPVVPDYSQSTPKTDLTATRYGLAGSLAAGIPLMFIGPFLSARGRRLGRLNDLSNGGGE